MVKKKKGLNENVNKGLKILIVVVLVAIVFAFVYFFNNPSEPMLAPFSSNVPLNASVEAYIICPDGISCDTVKERCSQQYGFPRINITTFSGVNLGEFRIHLYASFPTNVSTIVSVPEGTQQLNLVYSYADCCLGWNGTACAEGGVDLSVDSLKIGGVKVHDSVRVLWELGDSFTVNYPWINETLGRRCKWHPSPSFPETGNASHNSLLNNSVPYNGGVDPQFLCYNGRWYSTDYANLAYTYFNRDTGYFNASLSDWGVIVVDEKDSVGDWKVVSSNLNGELPQAENIWSLDAAPANGLSCSIEGRLRTRVLDGDSADVSISYTGNPESYNLSLQYYNVSSRATKDIYLCNFSSLSVPSANPFGKECGWEDAESSHNSSVDLIPGVYRAKAYVMNSTGFESCEKDVVYLLEDCSQCGDFGVDCTSSLCSSFGGCEWDSSREVCGEGSGSSLSCSPNWNCTEWSDVSGQCGTRTCNDLNRCGTNVGKPSISKSCGAANSGNSAVCGNGDVESGEECDDGNAVSGDGCSSRCKEESADTSGVFFWIIVGLLIFLIFVVAMVLILVVLKKNKLKGNNSGKGTNTRPPSKPFPPKPPMMKRVNTSVRSMANYR